VASYETATESTDWQALHHLASTRIQRFRQRLAFLIALAVVCAIYVPIGWLLPCWGAIVLTELIERRMARRLATAGAVPDGNSKCAFAAAHVSTAMAVAGTLCALWLSTDPVAHTIPLAFLAISMLNVAIANNQVRSLLLARQGIYVATAMLMTLRDVLAGPGLATVEAIALLLPITILAAFVLLMSHRSALTYRRRLDHEAELAATRQAAERANAGKSAFIATVGHELRTPLNGILGMAQALISSGLRPEQEEQARVVLDSGHALNALLTDLLDHSKLDAGKLSIEPVAADPRRTVDEVARLYGPVAESKGLRLDIDIATDIPATLVFDPVRVRQCLSNLVTNALKFTEVGTVGLTVSTVPAGSGSGGRRRHLVTMAVSDTGIGIPADRQTHLFQPFAQADGTIARRFGGTGLGLSITRQLAESMGGRVGLVSQPGKGSTFTLTFLADEAPAGIHGPEPTPALAERRVLVVDDIESNRLVIRLFLRPLGIEVVEAADGLAALDALRTGPFDAAFLDLHLPELGGAEVAARIRRGEAGRPDLALLAVTADSFDSGIDFAAAGFDAVISKPVDPHQIQSKLATAMRHRAAQPSGDMQVATAPHEETPGS